MVQFVAASEVALRPAWMLVASTPSINHQEAEAPRKKKKQAAAAVAKNEQCGVDAFAQSTFDHVEGYRYANSYCHLLFSLRRYLGLL